MHKIFRTTMALAAAPAMMLAALAPNVAMAHPKLVSSTPAANAAVTAPKTLSLTFSENLIVPLSSVTLTMTGMPGMAGHKPMPVKGFTTAIKGKTMTLSLPRALPAGTYVLEWRVVAADQHRINGKQTFSVK